MKIYKHIPLEREMMKLSHTWRRWKEDEWRENPWRMKLGRKFWWEWWKGWEKSERKWRRERKVCGSCHKWEVGVLFNEVKFGLMRVIRSWWVVKWCKWVVKKIFLWLWREVGQIDERLGKEGYFWNVVRNEDECGHELV